MHTGVASNQFPREMNMNNPLVPGTIQKIYENGASTVECPYVQIIHLKSFEKDSAATRYK